MRQGEPSAFVYFIVNGSCKLNRHVMLNTGHVNAQRYHPQQPNEPYMRISTPLLDSDTTKHFHVELTLLGKGEICGAWECLKVSCGDD